MHVLCQFWVFELWNQFHLEDRAKNVISHRNGVFWNHGSGHLGCVLLALVCSFLVHDINDINITEKLGNEFTRFETWPDDFKTTSSDQCIISVIHNNLAWNIMWHEQTLLTTVSYLMLNLKWNKTITFFVQFNPFYRATTFTHHWRQTNLWNSQSLSHVSTVILCGPSKIRLTVRAYALQQLFLVFETTLWNSLWIYNIKT